jgi:hypothetical protein
MSASALPIPLAIGDHPRVRQCIAVLPSPQADMILVGETSNRRDAIERGREW